MTATTGIVAPLYENCWPLHNLLGLGIDENTVANLQLLAALNMEHALIQQICCANPPS